MAATSPPSPAAVAGVDRDVATKFCWTMGPRPSPGPPDRRPDGCHRTAVRDGTHRGSAGRYDLKGIGEVDLLTTQR